MSNFSIKIEKPWMIAFTVFLLLVFFSISFFNQIMIKILHRRPEVAVPRIEGRSIQSAAKLLEPLKLTVEEEATDFDESVPAGTIIRQHPAEGMMVREGRSIKVVVSRGGQAITVPDLIGRALIEAQNLLANQGLQMGSLNEIYSADIPAGAIMTQNPSSGTVVARGALIDIDASKGPLPDGAMIIPNFLGRSVSEVRKWTETNNIGLQIREQTIVGGTPGTVTKQVPSVGQPVLEGDKVRVTVVKGG
jgi:serine/threonine-protein kinase